MPMLNHSNKKSGCLIIHGFGGNVKEVSPLAEYLAHQGFSTICPTLRGHTGNRKDLMNCTYKDWVTSAQKSYDQLYKECDRIFIIGFSMGGLIAIQLANNNPVEAIVTLNTPIYVWNIKNIFLNIIQDIRCKNPMNTFRYLNACMSFPMKALIHFKRLLKCTKNIMKNVTCPLFVVQSLNDDTVKLKSSDYIYQHVASPQKKKKIYEKSGHLILWSKISSLVMVDIGVFLKNI
ncbi:MAG: alpha/beta hydrolase [Eubacteriales bacterium]